MNELCDQLAVAASEGKNLKVDEAYESDKNPSSGLF
jgi:hypothetical protein